MSGSLSRPTGFSAERSLITPEGVDLKVQIATAGERAGAYLLDQLFIFLVIAGASVVLYLIAVMLTAVVGRAWVPAGLAMIWLIGAFLLRNFYFVYFETRPRAATPGKRINGLRVAMRNGGRLSFEAVFARNVMREIEFFLPLSFLAADNETVGAVMILTALVWTGIFLFFPLFNRDRLRVGDLVGGTWVVKSPKLALMPDLSSAPPREIERFAFTRAQLDAYGVKELQVLEGVLRKNSLATIVAVAARIREKIDWERQPGETDHEFLEAYYAALRGRLEGGLLMGRRRKDKFDR
jgi:uncharacterized RDD family membrane protein YckC